MSYSKFRPRRGTTLQWANANTLLNEGEIAFEFANRIGDGVAKVKIGDGVRRWDELPYAINMDEVINECEKISDIERDLDNVKILVDELYNGTAWEVIAPAGTYTDDDHIPGASVKVLNEISYKVMGGAVHIRGNISLVKMGSASLFDYITLGAVNNPPTCDLSFLFAVSSKTNKPAVGFSIKITTDGKVQLVPTVLGDTSSADNTSYAIMTGAFEFNYFCY